jgi:hypothetical protein
VEVRPVHASIALLLLALTSALPVGAQAPVPATTEAADSAGPSPLSAQVTWNAKGLSVLFPRHLSPDSITYESRVGDRFSGFEWRIILVSDRRAYLSALVIPPSDSLTIHRVESIAEAYRVGDLRSCDRTTANLVLRCNRLAQGLVRDVGGRLEITIVDTRWMDAILTSRAPKLRLLVKVAQETVWEEEVEVRWGG